MTDPLGQSTFRIARDPNSGAWVAPDHAGKVQPLSMNWGDAVRAGQKLWGEHARATVVNYNALITSLPSQSVALKKPEIENALTTLRMKQKYGFEEHLNEEVRDLALAIRVTTSEVNVDAADLAARFLRAHGSALKGNTVRRIQGKLPALNRLARKERGKLPKGGMRTRFDAAFTAFRKALVGGAAALDKTQSPPPEVQTRKIIQGPKTAGPEMDTISGIRNGWFRATVVLPPGKYKEYTVGPGGSEAAMDLKIVNGKIDWLHSKVTFRPPPKVWAWIRMSELLVRDFDGEGNKILVGLKGFFDPERTKELLGISTVPSVPLALIQALRNAPQTTGGPAITTSSLRYRIDVTAFKDGARIKLGDSALVLESDSTLQIRGDAKGVVLSSDRLKARALTIREGSTRIDASNVRGAFSIRLGLKMPSFSELPVAEVRSTNFRIDRAVINKMQMKTQDGAASLSGGTIKNAIVVINPPDSADGRGVSDISFDGEYSGNIDKANFIVKRKGGKGQVQVNLEGRYTGNVRMSDAGLGFSGVGTIKGTLKGLRARVVTSDKETIELKSSVPYRFAALGPLEISPGVIKLATPYPKGSSAIKSRGFSIDITRGTLGMAYASEQAAKLGYSISGARFNLSIAGNGFDLSKGLLKLGEVKLLAQGHADNVSMRIEMPTRKKVKVIDATLNVIGDQFEIAPSKVKPLTLVKKVSDRINIQNGQGKVEFELIPGAYLAPGLRVPPGQGRRTMTLKAEVKEGKAQRVLIEFSPTLDPNGSTVLVGFHSITLTPDPANPGRMQVDVDLTGLGEWGDSERNASIAVERALARHFEDGIILQDVNAFMVGVNAFLSSKTVLEPMLLNKPQGDLPAGTELRTTYTVASDGKTLKGVSVAQGKRSLELGPGADGKTLVLLNQQHIARENRASSALKAIMRQSFPQAIPADFSKFKKAFHKVGQPLSLERMDFQTGKGKVRDARLLIDKNSGKVHSFKFKLFGQRVLYTPSPRDPSVMVLSLPGLGSGGSYLSALQHMLERQLFRALGSSPIPSDSVAFQERIAMLQPTPHDPSFIKGVTDLTVKEATILGPRVVTVSSYSGPHLLKYTKRATFEDILNANPELDSQLAKFVGPKVRSLRAEAKSRGLSIDQFFSRTESLKNADLRDTDIKTVVIPSVVRFGNGNRIEILRGRSTIENGVTVIRADAQRLVLGQEGDMHIDGGPGRVVIRLTTSPVGNDGAQKVSYRVTTDAIAIRNLGVRADNTTLDFNGGLVQNLLFMGSGILEEKSGRSVMTNGRVTISADIKGPVTGSIPVVNPAGDSVVGVENWFYDGTFFLEQGRSANPAAYRETMQTIGFLASSWGVAKESRGRLNLLGEVLEKPSMLSREERLAKLSALRQRVSEFFPAHVTLMSAYLASAIDQLLPTEIRLEGKVAEVKVIGNEFKVGNDLLSMTGYNIEAEVSSRDLTPTELSDLWRGIQDMKKFVPDPTKRRGLSGTHTFPMLEKLYATKNVAELKGLVGRFSEGKHVYIKLAQEVAALDKKALKRVHDTILHGLVPWVADLKYTTRTGLGFDGHASIRMGIKNGSSKIDNPVGHKASGHRGSKVGDGPHTGSTIEKTTVLKFGEGTFKAHLRSLQAGGVLKNLYFDTEPSADERYAATLSMKVEGGALNLSNRGKVKFLGGDLNLKFKNLDFSHDAPTISAEVTLNVAIAGENLGNVPGESPVAAHGRASTVVGVKIGSLTALPDPENPGFLLIKMKHVDPSLGIDIKDLEVQMARLIRLLSTMLEEKRESSSPNKAKRGAESLRPAGVRTQAG